MAHDLILGQTNSNFSRRSSIGASALTTNDQANKAKADAVQAVDSAAASMQATTNNVYLAKNLNRITPASFEKFRRLHDDFFTWKKTAGTSWPLLAMATVDKAKDIIAKANDYRTAARAFQIGTIDPVVRNVLAKPADREYRKPPKVSAKATPAAQAAATQTPQEAAEIKRIAATPIPPALLRSVADAQIQQRTGQPPTRPTAPAPKTAARRPAPAAARPAAKKPVAKKAASQEDVQQASMVTTSSNPLETIKAMSTGKKLALGASVVGLGLAGYMLTREKKPGSGGGASRTPSAHGGGGGGLRTAALRPAVR